MKYFSLTTNLDIDITRSVSDMAAFFGYALAEKAELTLCVRSEQGEIVASLQELRAVEPVADAAASGEVTRCVKLAVLAVFAKLTGAQPKLPWGILTGVRPTLTPSAVCTLLRRL